MKGIGLGKLELLELLGWKKEKEDLDCSAQPNMSFSSSLASWELQRHLESGLCRWVVWLGHRELWSLVTTDLGLVVLQCWSWAVAQQAPQTEPPASQFFRAEGSINVRSQRRSTTIEVNYPASAD
jgi:hypothetical protein